MILRDNLQFCPLQGIDLNNALTAAERADAEAFTALVESRLQKALQYSLWLEEENYRAYRQVYGAALPFPLNRILAYVALKKLEAQFKSQEIDQVLERKCTGMRSRRTAPWLRNSGFRGTSLGTAPPAWMRRCWRTSSSWRRRNW
jgi:hypothetical protein